VLLERYIKGRDLAVSVLDAAREGPVLDAAGEEPVLDAAGEGPVRSQSPQPQALPVVEAVPREDDFYDFEARYEIGRTTFLCPAELPGEVAAKAQDLALEVYELLGCRGFARVDLMLEQSSGELWVLETNAIPGFTETSLLPQAADAAGIDFDALVSRILLSAPTR
jgi:D-alanine-D-alanine ligase